MNCTLIVFLHEISNALMHLFDPRKGVPAHAEMLQQLLKGIDVEEGGTIVVLDIIPNKTFAWRLSTFLLLRVSIARCFWESNSFHWSFLLLLQMISSYCY